MNTTNVTANNNASGNQVQSNKLNLKTTDFINMMVTQLQNQDPMNPTSNSELLAQMSQIGQLQSANSLQDSLTQSNTLFQSTLKSLVAQNQLGAAGNMIGKMVQGTDANGTLISGLVNSVQVDSTSGEINLELDNGKSLAFSKITAIAAGQ